METLTLNDGTVVNGHCLLDDRDLFVYLDGMTVVEGVTLFADPERASVITETNRGFETVYEGYTEIYAANHEFGNCNLIMRKKG